MGYMYEPDIIALSKIPFHTPIGRDASMLIEGETDFSEKEDELRSRAVRFDPHTAFLWFREAARHSPDYVEDMASRGKFLYARCFLDGLGTDFDREKANRLMLIAAREGSADALESIETSAPYLLPELGSPERIAEYKRLLGLGTPEG